MRHSQNLRGPEQAWVLQESADWRGGKAVLFRFTHGTFTMRRFSLHADAIPTHHGIPAVSRSRDLGSGILSFFVFHRSLCWQAPYENVFRSGLG